MHLILKLLALFRSKPVATVVINPPGGPVTGARDLADVLTLVCPRCSQTFRVGQPCGDPACVSCSQRGEPGVREGLCARCGLLLVWEEGHPVRSARHLERLTWCERLPHGKALMTQLEANYRLAVRARKTAAQLAYRSSN